MATSELKEYAVNLADLTRFAQKPLSPPMLLLQPVLSTTWVSAEPKRFDGAAVLLDCDEERAQAIASVIRLKIPKHLLRLYVGSGASWKRI